MFALWMFGSVLENLWGPKRFLIYYMITGIGAALIHTLSTWYEIHQLTGIIENYAASPNLVDFIALMKKNVSYITTDSLTEINNFINNWEMNQGDTSLMNQSVTIAYKLVEYKGNIPTVGASGAVFGLLLAFGMLFPNQLIYLYFAIPIKAKYFVALYGLFELWNGVSNNPGDNVAHFAHLGGMLFGFFMIKYWNKKNRQHFY
jgi:membrane associated rhomboid family serine protease